MSVFDPVRFGTPGSPSALKVMLLGSGELGKEVIIALQRLGVEAIAVDRYADAPGHQVAHRSYVIDMTDGVSLVRAGKDPATPVAVVHKAYSPQQRSVRGTLDTITEQVLTQQIGNPAVIVIGDVVGQLADPTDPTDTDGADAGNPHAANGSS